LTAVLANPSTVAEKESDAPCAIVAIEGVMVIDPPVVATAYALTVGSATLVATKW
jgi:hypothetical protein